MTYARFLFELLQGGIRIDTILHAVFFVDGSKRCVVGGCLNKTNVRGQRNHNWNRDADVPLSMKLVTIFAIAFM